MTTTSSEATRRQVWISGLILLVGLLQALWPMVASGFTRTVGGLQDTRLVHFSLEHAHRFVSGEAERFFDPPLFFPARNVAAYTDVMISLTPLYSPWRWFGMAPDPAFQLWIVLVLALNFLTFFAVLRALGCQMVGASAGAYLFAFGSSRLANIGHPQLLPGFFIALAILAVVRFFSLKADSRWASRGWLSLFFLALIGQAYGAFYPLYFFALCVGFAWFVALCLPSARELWIRRWRDEWVLFAVFSVLAVLAVVPLFERYLITAEVLGSRSWDAIEPLLPRWSSWLLMGTGHRLFGGLQETAFVLAQGPSMRTGTHSNGLGLLTLIFVAIGLWRARQLRSVRILLLATLITIAVTTVLPGGFSLWRLFFGYFPGADAVRAVGRIGMFLLIPAGFGLALFCDRLVGRRSVLVLVAVLAVVSLEQAHAVKSFDRLAAREAVARVVAAVEAEQESRDCLAFFVTTVGPRKYSPIHEDAEWAALELDLPTVNGRYGNWPPGWDFAVAHRYLGPKGQERLRELVGGLRSWTQHYGLRPERICWLEFDADFHFTPHTFEAASSCRP